MKLWLVLKVSKWEDLQFDGDIIKVQPQDGMFGLCHVFNNYEMALEKADGNKDLVYEVKAI